MKAEFETITPAKAQSLLEKSDFRNRILNKATVSRYAYAMQNGKWKANGEGIIMNCNGAVINGQHRLHAIIKAGKPVGMLVVKGVSIDAFDTMDTGRKRTNGDVLGIAGYQDRTTLAAALVVLHSYKTAGVFGKTDVSSRHLLRSACPPILEMAEMYPDLCESIHFVNGYRKGNEDLAPVSLTSVLHYLFNEKDSECCDAFFEAFISGTTSGQGCPVKALIQAYRAPMVKASLNSSTEVKAAYWIKAWNAYVQGKKINKILWNAENHDFPSIL